MIIKGDQNIEVPNHIHFGKYVLDHFRNVPDGNICLENGLTGETLTYKEVTQFSVNLAAALTKLGVGKSDVVAIGSEQFLHYMPTVIGITLAGAVYTPYSAEIGRTELKHYLHLVKPKYFICSSLFWQSHKELLQTFNCIEICIAVTDIPELPHSLKSLTVVDVNVDKFEPTPVEGKTDTVFILYSSGTTGMRKGVEITHYSCIITIFPDARMDTLKTAFIMGHFMPNFYLFMTFKFLLLGRKIVFTTDRSMERVLPILRNSKVDIVFSNPVHIRAIALSDIEIGDYFDTVKMIYCRSFPLRAQTIKLFKDRFPRVKHVIQAYGLTECGEPMSEINASIYRPGSVGIVSPGIFAKIVNPTTRDILGPNEQGEICIKGHTIMKGYLDIEMHKYMDEDGFYKTGDLGYYDEDKYFYITERITDVIHNRGYKVSPVDLENLLIQHPAVLDAGVVGKQDPTDDQNHLPMAFVVKKPQYDVTEQELMDFVAPEVSPMMQLKGGVKFISEIPRNERGKTLRRQLREILNQTA